MKQSESNTLNRHDWKQWSRNTLLFSSPAIIAFCMALQNGGSLEFAGGAAYSALLSSVIDLSKKFIQGEK